MRAFVIAFNGHREAAATRTQNSITTMKNMRDIADDRQTNSISILPHHSHVSYAFSCWSETNRRNKNDKSDEQRFRRIVENINRFAEAEFWLNQMVLFYTFVVTIRCVRYCTGEWWAEYREWIKNFWNDLLPRRIEVISRPMQWWNWNWVITSDVHVCFFKVI